MVELHLIASCQGSDLTDLTLMPSVLRAPPRALSVRMAIRLIHLWNSTLRGHGLVTALFADADSMRSICPRKSRQLRSRQILFLSFLNRRSFGESLPLILVDESQSKMRLNRPEGLKLSTKKRGGGNKRTDKFCRKIT